MRAIITKDGGLHIFVETGLEGYAINHWGMQNSVHVDNKTLLKCDKFLIHTNPQDIEEMAILQKQ